MEKDKLHPVEPNITVNLRQCKIRISRFPYMNSMVLRWAAIHIYQRYNKPKGDHQYLEIYVNGGKC